MSVIVPAVLPTSLADLEDKLARLAGLTDSVQIDSVDGRFASPACWPYRAAGPTELATLADRSEELSHGGRLRLEIDLMVADPQAVAGTWLAAGASRLIVHADALHSLDTILSDFEHVYGHDKEFDSGLLTLGVGVGPLIDLALIEPYLPRVDFVQFMGIRTIGTQGQPFDSSVLQKIKAFRKRHPTLPFQVDGGVSKRTAPALLSAGVSRLVVGSALWKAPDLRAELKELEALAEEYGIYE
jgi:ribulose-phosphate 3-epimerase